MSKYDKLISRRDALKFIPIVGAAAMALACKLGVSINPETPGATNLPDTATPQPSQTGVPTNPATSTPLPNPNTATPIANPFTATSLSNPDTITPQPSQTGIPTNTATNTATATARATETLQPGDISGILKAEGVKIELPRANWPTTYQEVADILKSPMIGDYLTPDKITAVVETDATGQKYWRGWYIAEPPFPLKQGIKFDSNKGVHVDSHGTAVFDPQKIFETDWNKLPDNIKNNFPDFLVNLKINKPGYALFARRGGATRDNLPKNTHYFAGTEGVEVSAIEQLTLIPVPENLCPDDIRKASLTKAYRQAVLEFRDNSDAKNGKVDIQWFNPESGLFSRVDGRMITKLARQGVDLSILERLTPGYPVSPEKMKSIIGGRADKWVFEPNSGEWFWEAYPYKPGITYKEGVGPINSQGKLLYGYVQADSRTSQVFNFSTLDVAALSSGMAAPSEMMQADLFARAGGYSANPNIKNHSWYTWDNGDITLTEKAIEQGRLEMVNVGSCPISDLETVLKARVERLAKDQKDPNVTALYWNGTKFIKA